MTDYCWVLRALNETNDSLKIFSTEEKAKEYLLSVWIIQDMIKDMMNFRYAYYSIFEKKYEPLEDIIEKLKLYMNKNRNLENLDLEFMENIYKEIKKLQPWLDNFKRDCNGKANGTYTLKGEVKEVCITDFTIYDPYVDYSIEKHEIRHESI